MPFPFIQFWDHGLEDLIHLGRHLISSIVNSLQHSIREKTFRTKQSLNRWLKALTFHTNLKVKRTNSEK